MLSNKSSSLDLFLKSYLLEVSKKTALLVLDCNVTLFTLSMEQHVSLYPVIQISFTIFSQNSNVGWEKASSK